MIGDRNKETQGGLKAPANAFEAGVTRRYSGEDGEEYHRSKHVIPDKVYAWVADLRAEKIGPFLREEDTVLEYGVGNGWNLSGLNCHSRLGFDLSEHLKPVVVDHGIRFINDISAIADASVDAVVCHHVLEHTAVPTQTLCDIWRVLRPGGRILLFVPCEEGRRYHRYVSREPNHHLYSWNVQTLGNLMADFGFKICSAETGRFGYDRFSGVAAYRLHLGKTGFRFIRQVLHLFRPVSEVRIVAEVPHPGKEPQAIPGRKHQERAM